MNTFVESSYNSPIVIVHNLNLTNLRIVLQKILRPDHITPSFFSLSGPIPYPLSS